MSWDRASSKHKYRYGGYDNYEDQNAESVDSEDELDSFKKQLKGSLSAAVGLAGAACVHGKIEEDLPFPAIKIRKNNMAIALPVVLAEQAQQIIDHCQQAPFGKGTETITDKAIRDCWQLDATEISIANPYWDSKIQEIVRTTVGPGLGIQGSETCVRAELYKLLMYEKGGHFKPHRDSEKADGMFGTMIIQLPSVFSGGAIHVNHNQKLYHIDFSASENAEYGFQYAAFYADCEHEVKPLERGYRLALIYNLIFEGKGNQSFSIPDPEISAELEPLLKSFNEADSDCDPSRFVIPLAHMYSEASLSARNLKGKDAYLFASLRECARKGLIQIQLGTLEILAEGQQHGDMEQHYRIKVHGVLQPLCERAECEALPEPILKSVKACELLSLHSGLSSLEPYDHEAFPTGNEGTQVKRFYRTSGLVICPARLRHSLFFDEDDIEKGVNRLKSLCEQNTAQAWTELSEVLPAFLELEALEYDSHEMKRLVKALIKVGRECSAAARLISMIAAEDMELQELLDMIWQFSLAYGSEHVEQVWSLVNHNLGRYRSAGAVIKFAKQLEQHVNGKNDPLLHPFMAPMLKALMKNFDYQVKVFKSRTHVDLPTMFLIITSLLQSVPADATEHLKQDLLRILQDPANVNTLLTEVFSADTSGGVFGYFNQVLCLGGTIDDQLWASLRNGLLAWATDFFNRCRPFDSFFDELNKLQQMSPKENAPEKRQTLAALFRYPLQHYSQRYGNAVAMSRYISMIPDSELQKDLHDIYVAGLENLSVGTFLIDLKVPDVKDILLSLSSIKPTFLGDFAEKLATSCAEAPGIRLCLQQAARALAVLCSLGYASRMEAAVNGLVKMEKAQLFKFAKSLKTALGPSRVKNPIYVKVVLDLYKRQRAEVDAIAIGNNKWDISEWPCGLGCGTCGKEVYSFLTGNSEFMTWTSPLATKSLQVRDSTHVYGTVDSDVSVRPRCRADPRFGAEAGVKMGLECEKVPPKSVKLTKNKNLLRKKLVDANEKLMEPYKQLAQGIDVETGAGIPVPKKPKTPNSKKRPATAIEHTNVESSMSAKLTAEICDFLDSVEPDAKRMKLE